MIIFIKEKVKKRKPRRNQEGIAEAQGENTQRDKENGYEEPRPAMTYKDKINNKEKKVKRNRKLFLKKTINGSE